jgi:RNA polymerase sigma factor (sigma-70 family)
MRVARSTASVTDQQLVDRARRGDTAAFDELMDRHEQAVYRTALAAVGSPCDAEEVVQDAFLRAFRHLGAFRQEASFRTWVASIAWRQGLSRRRGVIQRLRRFVRPSEAQVPEPSAHGGSAETNIIVVERLHAATAMIRTLPARLRDPLLLAATGEHSYAAIASMLRISEGTLKWRISEARRIVRKKLEALGHEP